MHRILIIAVCLMATLAIVFGVAGRLTNYSALPVGSMWSQMLEFYVSYHDNQPMALFSWFDLHRPVIPRLLYLAGFVVSPQPGLMLQIVSAGFVVCVGLLFWYAISRMLVGKSPAAAAPVAALCLTAWLFFWSPQEYAKWSLHLQFLPSILLPFASLMALERSSIPGRRGSIWFAVSCAFGAASAATMANGLLLLPVLLTCSVALGASRLRLATLVLMSAGVAAFYFGAGSGTEFELSRFDLSPPTVLGLIGMWVSALGSPFYALLGGGFVAEGLAALAGAGLLAATFRTVLVTYRYRRDNSACVVLATALAYSVLTALGWSASSQDLSGHAGYEMPAVVAWAILFCYYTPFAIRSVDNNRPNSLSSLAILATLTAGFAGYQASAMTSKSIPSFETKVAMIALTLGIDDAEFIQSLRPDTKNVSLVGSEAKRMRLLAFGEPPYSTMAAKIGKNAERRTLPQCSGSVDEVVALYDTSEFVRVGGWLYNPQKSLMPDLIEIVDSRGKVVGFASTGKIREDLVSTMGDAALAAGFVGYIRSSVIGGNLEIQSLSAGCSLSWRAGPSQ